MSEGVVVCILFLVPILIAGFAVLFFTRGGSAPTGWRYLKSHEILQKGDRINNYSTGAYSEIPPDAIGEPVFSIPYFNRLYKVIRKK